MGLRPSIPVQRSYALAGGQGFESRRIHFQNQRGASTLQNREITVLMSELQFNPILFSCRGKTRDLQ